MNLVLKHAIIDYLEPAYRIAQRLGISPTTLSKFIAEIQKPTTEQKMNLAKLLGKKESDLFPQDDKKIEESRS